MTNRPRNSGPARFGAYGIAVCGLDSEQSLLVVAKPDWPTVRIVIEPGPPADAGTSLDEHTARYPDPPGHVVVDRTAGVASIRGVDGLTPDAIAHPRLGMIGALYAQWLPGRMAFHAGAFVSGGRAWAVVGGQGDGKSTLMAALAMAGAAVVGDDTLVLDGMRCLPGVRCVDLRPDAAAQLAVSPAAAPVRHGMRHRMPLPGAPHNPVLGGWIFLRWGDAVEMREMAPAERLPRIAAVQGWHRRGVTDPSALLEAASLPAWELRRPRDWALLPDVVGRLTELTAGAR